MLIRPVNGFDFEMVYYNADGQEGTMCGNGGRCLAAYALRSGKVKGPEIRFLACDGPHEAVAIKSDQVLLKMNDVDEIIEADEGYLIDTGSPHYVRVVEGLHAMDVTSEGRAVRFGPRFAEKGVNVNYIEWIDGVLHVRTYERGVEAETLSCGTGVTASALLAHRLGWNQAQDTCVVSTAGGLLKVSYLPAGSGYRDVWLEGPATFVFKGEIDL